MIRTPSTTSIESFMNDSTIIIGAGIAGLAAASKLREAGKDVVILEATDRAGGRMIRIQHGQDWAEAGAQGIHTSYSGTLDLIQQYGLSSELVLQTAEQVGYLDRDGSRIHPKGQIGMFKLLGLRGSIDMAWFLTKYVALGKKFPFFQTELDIPSYDNLSINDAFNNKSQAFKDYILNPCAHAMVGSDLHNTNLYHFLNLMKLVLSTKVMTLRTGNASLPEKIAASFNVRYNSPVEQLIYKNQRVTGVRLQSGELIESPHVIVATPIGAAAKILPTDLVPEKQFLDSFLNIPLSLVFFFLKNPYPSEAYIYFGHGHRKTPFNMGIHHTLKTPHSIPSGKGVISAWPAYPDTERLLTMSDEEVIDKALNNMEKFFPGIHNDIDVAKVQRHNWGLGRISAGQHGKILAFKRRSEALRGVSFANSDYDGVHMESGVQSGLRAAQRVLHGL